MAHTMNSNQLKLDYKIDLVSHSARVEGLVKYIPLLVLHIFDKQLKD